MTFLFILALAFPIASFGATEYSCSTEFGETVPIRKIVLKKNASCKPCDSVSAKIAPELVEKNLSRTWNLEVESDSRLNSKTKRQSFNFDQRLIFLDTRYAKQPGPSFRFQLDCSEKAKAPKSKCSGHFVDTENKNFLRLQTAVADRRIKNNQGIVEIKLGDREHLGFITRVFKKAVPLTESEQISTSASGEFKFLHEDSEFIQDVGTDEQLYLLNGLRTRIAAFEVKIRCHALNLHPPSSLE